MLEIKWFLENLKGKRRVYCVGLALCAAVACMYIITPHLTSLIVDHIYGGGSFRDVSPLLAAIAAVVLGRSLMRYAMLMIFEHVSQELLIGLREKLYINLQRQDFGFYDKNRVGDIMTKMTGDLDAVRHFCAYVVYCTLESTVIFITSMIYLLPISVTLTLSLLALSPAILVLTYKMSKRIRPMYTKIRESFSKLNTATQENIAGNRVVKAFVREEHEKEKFDRCNREYRDINVETQFLWLRYGPPIDLIAQVMTVISLMLGALFVIWGDISMGNLIAFTGLTWTLIYPMRMIGLLVNDTQRFFASVEKVTTIYYAKTDIESPPDAYKTGRARGRVSFENVTVRYDTNTVLKNVSFEVQPGQTVGIIGPTGSGKTSFVNLIPRFYDAAEGEVKLDGVNVRKYDLECLRKNVAVTMQDVFLYSDTIEGNIAFCDPEMPIEDVKHFARAAAADFIYEMPDGMDTIIGERGVGLSGGQKQRIALARALASKAPVLILDDTTSAVDMETEAFIQKSLRELDYSCTKFIIAQRISSVREADMIIVIKDGGIAQRGSHRELAAAEGYYRDICILQNVKVPELEAGGNGKK